MTDNKDPVKLAIDALDRSNKAFISAYADINAANKIINFSHVNRAMMDQTRERLMILVDQNIEAINALQSQPALAVEDFYDLREKMFNDLKSVLNTDQAYGANEAFSYLAATGRIAGVIEDKPKIQMVSNEWLRKKIENEPDIECQAGPCLSATVDTYKLSAAESGVFAKALRKSVKKIEPTDGVPDRIWICPSGDKVYSIEKDQNATPELQYVHALSADQERRELMAAIDDFPRPSVGDNSNMVRRVLDWMDKHAHVIERCREGGE